LPIDPYGNLTTFVGERFPYTPEWQATTDGEYEFSAGSMRWSMGGSINYRSDSYSNFGENNMFLLDERVLVDVRAGLVDPAGNWRVQLYGRNVTDEHYYTQTSRLTDTVVSYTGMPRTYGIQFSYRY
jgi:outer membrane receptor protein involved in Fe transport